MSSRTVLARASDEPQRVVDDGRPIVAQALGPIELVLEGVDGVTTVLVDEHDLHRRQQRRNVAVEGVSEDGHGELPAGQEFLDQDRLTVAGVEPRQQGAQASLVVDDAIDKLQSPPRQRHRMVR